MPTFRRDRSIKVSNDPVAFCVVSAFPQVTHKRRANYIDFEQLSVKVQQGGLPAHDVENALFLFTCVEGVLARSDRPNALFAEQFLEVIVRRGAGEL